MIGPTRSNRKCLSLFATVCVVLVFLILLNSFQNIRYPRFIEEIPYADKNPGAYVKYAFPTPNNTSYCKFNYGLPTQLNYNIEDLSGSPELDSSSPYFVLYNVIEGSLNDFEPPVTYVTQLSANFVVFISEVLRFWEGPVSVAAYIPDGDPHLILQTFLQFCYCIPDTSRLSLHFVFRKESLPYMKFYLSNMFLPPSSCDVRDVEKVETVVRKSNSNFSRNVADNNETQVANNNWYPINVCRNAARYAAFTAHVMVSDVELMPSAGMASRFLKMLNEYKCSNPLECANRVFVVPVFEVEATENLPRTKKQLVDLLVQERAVYFHRFICGHCQKFPGLEAWMDSNPGENIKPLLVTKREVPYHRWEPIYIGTKIEPLYHEALSWEGFQDKMLQMLEMCLMNYKLVILDGAFLVHWPGMKKIKSKTIESWRIPFMKTNQRQYNSLLKNISEKYTPNPHCRPR